MSPNKSSTPFMYRPLKEGEIRILQLETDGVDFKLSMKHRHLDDQLPFTAVSYTWGLETSKTDLVIDGQKLKVLKSLASMVKSLSEDKYPKRNLWIDAICINQESTQDRNHQVKMMGNIYSRAARVIVYLGLNTTRTRLVKWAYTVGATHDALVHDSRSEFRDQAILPMLSHRYFTRRWIIQEFALAREIEIHYKGGRVTLAELEHLAQTDRETSSAQSSAADLCELRTDMRASSRTLEELLYDYENAGCSRYHDKIYALLPLSRQAQHHLLIDYNLDRMELLLLVLDTCSRYEDLNPLRTISFSCFLYQHLGILWDHLAQHIQRQSFRNLADTTTFTATAVLRGIVLGHTSGQEHFITPLRPGLPTLRNYAPVDLNRHRIESVVSHRHSVSFAESSALQSTGSISSSDQIPFTTVPKSMRNPSHNCIGLSTIITQSSDQVWQFPRVPLALILRPTTSGYTMIARAQLLKRQNHAGGRIEDLLDWFAGDTEETTGTCSVLNFIMTPRQLILMWYWVNLDH